MADPRNRENTVSYIFSSLYSTRGPDLRLRTLQPFLGSSGNVRHPTSHYLRRNFTENRPRTRQRRPRKSHPQHFLRFTSAVRSTSREDAHRWNATEAFGARTRRLIDR